MLRNLFASVARAERRVWSHRISPRDRPLLLGVSRKSMIAAILGESDLNLRDWPTVAITSRARERGVMLHRVHAVRSNVQALRMVEAILEGAD